MKGAFEHCYDRCYPTVRQTKGKAIAVAQAGEQHKITQMEVSNKVSIQHFGKPRQEAEPAKHVRPRDSQQEGHATKHDITSYQSVTCKIPVTQSLFLHLVNANAGSGLRSGRSRIMESNT